MDDPEVIGYIVASTAAMMALLIMRPRWDTGGGMMMILSLGSIAWPAIVAWLVAIYGAYTIFLLLFVIWKIISGTALLIWWMLRWLLEPT